MFGERVFGISVSLCGQNVDISQQDAMIRFLFNLSIELTEL